MPDDADYEAFFGLLARPETWTEEDLRSVEFHLREQQALLKRWHPKDAKRRESLASVVESIESALASYRARKHP